MSHKHRVFISHTHSDRLYAEELARELSKKGYETWALWDASGGSVIDQVQDAIASSDAYVVLLSKDSLSSPWVNFELGAAIGSNKALALVYLAEGIRAAAPESVRRLAAIEAATLRPAEVAERVAQVVQAA